MCASFEGYMPRIHHLWCSEILLPIFLSWTLIYIFLLYSGLHRSSSLLFLEFLKLLFKLGHVLRGFCQIRCNIERLYEFSGTSVVMMSLSLKPFEGMQWVNFFVIVLTLCKIHYCWSLISGRGLPKNFTIIIFLSSYARLFNKLRKRRLKGHPALSSSSFSDTWNTDTGFFSLLAQQPFPRCASWFAKHAAAFAKAESQDQETWFVVHVCG